MSAFTILSPLASLFIVFVVIFIGMFATKFRFVTNSGVSEILTIVYRIFFPVFLFGAVSKFAQSPENYGWIIGIFYAMLIVWVSVIFASKLFRYSWSEAASFALIASVPSALFAEPAVLFLFGVEYAGHAALPFAIAYISLFPLSQLIILLSNIQVVSLKNVVKVCGYVFFQVWVSYISIPLILGFALWLTPIILPKFLVELLEILALPIPTLGIFEMGFFIACYSPEKKHITVLICLIVIKTVVLPILAATFVQFISDKDTLIPIAYAISSAPTSLLCMSLARRTGNLRLNAALGILCYGTFLCGLSFFLGVTLLMVSINPNVALFAPFIPSDETIRALQEMDLVMGIFSIISGIYLILPYMLSSDFRVHCHDRGGDPSYVQVVFLSTYLSVALFIQGLSGVKGVLHQGPWCDWQGYLSQFFGMMSNGFFLIVTVERCLPILSETYANLNRERKYRIMFGIIYHTLVIISAIAFTLPAIGQMGPEGPLCWIIPVNLQIYLFWGPLLIYCLIGIGLIVGASIKLYLDARQIAQTLHQDQVASFTSKETENSNVLANVIYSSASAEKGPEEDGAGLPSRSTVAYQTFNPINEHHSDTIPLPPTELKSNLSSDKQLPTNKDFSITKKVAKDIQVYLWKNIALMLCFILMWLWGFVSRIQQWITGEEETIFFYAFMRSWSSSVLGVPLALIYGTSPDVLEFYKAAFYYIQTRFKRFRKWLQKILKIESGFVPLKQKKKGTDSLATEVAVLGSMYMQKNWADVKDEDGESEEEMSMADSLRYQGALIPQTDLGEPNWNYQSWDSTINET